MQSITSYQYQIAYVKSLPAASARDAAVDTIVTALRLPSIFDFDALFRIDAVLAAKDSDIYSLLQIFLNDGLAEYFAWVSSHGDVLTKYSTLSPVDWPGSSILTCWQVWMELSSSVKSGSSV